MSDDQARNLQVNENAILQMASEIENVHKTFSSISFEDDRAWEYFAASSDSSSDYGRERSRKLSQSTTSMISAALLASSRPESKRAANGYIWQSLNAESRRPLSSGLQDRTQKSVDMLASRWKESKGEGQEKTKILSSTFGCNDILTLSWYLDIFSREPDQLADKAAQSEAIVSECISIIVKRCTTLAELKVNGSYSNNGGWRSIAQHLFHCKAGKDGYFVCDTSYVFLRFARVLEFLLHSKSSMVNLTEAERLALATTMNVCFDRFRSGLNDQLALVGIENDSQFDFSELIFCFEGILLAKPDTLDDLLIDKIFAVVQRHEKHPTGWRGTIPMLASQKGLVLYPISVETGTSLVAAISRVNDQRRSAGGISDSFDFMPFLRGFWSWLRSRTVSIQLKEGSEVRGWKSENLDGEIVHCWENSQILEFIVILRDLFKGRVAARLLRSSRLSVETQAAHDNWDTLVNQFEPSPGSKNAVYEKIFDQFVRSRHLQKYEHDNWSMMLYGPPGTGKTSIAKNVAGYLGRPLVTVTVSDFLSEGDAFLERQAKMVFEALARQDGVIVLFDELDHLVLDRDSKLFNGQSQSIQLLTPGLLTKFGDLRSKERVMFIFATNYEQRIDSAIKRAGRFDQKILVLPPNLAARGKILTALLQEFPVDPELNAEHLSRLARLSLFMSYPELRNLMKRRLDYKSLEKDVRKWPRSIGFGSYKTLIMDENSDFFIQDSHKWPIDEIYGLYQLAEEANPGKHDDNNPSFETFKPVFNDIRTAISERVMEKFGTNPKAL